MNRISTFLMLALAVAVVGYVYFSGGDSTRPTSLALANKSLAERFDYLNRNGNSSCAASFRSGMMTMMDSDRLQGSCCSSMSMHRYSEQIEGLKKYQNIPEIPGDPYDVEAGLAKSMMSYYDTRLDPQEQEAYDYAMVNSHEKGPCCCQCWRWYVYGGLAKYLIKNYQFNGEQITEVWNLSDGCGGDEEHHHG